jgi:hypothetical protein
VPRRLPRSRPQTRASVRPCGVRWASWTLFGASSSRGWLSARSRRMATVAADGGQGGGVAVAGSTLEYAAAIGKARVRRKEIHSL